MAVFQVRQFGDPVLRRPALQVENVDGPLRKLIRDMTDTMLAAPGVGLAAPQIGISRRVIVWKDDQTQGALVNPRIVASEGSVEGDEGCLSLPGLYYPVVRASRITVEGVDAGGEVSFEAEDFLARIIQHEVDHLDGVLFIDRLVPDLQREAKRLLREMTLSSATPHATPAL